jgi:predicted ATP-grasp superfamily ATP-dependent carboligase
VPSLAVVDNLYDKAKLLAVARRINLPCPVTRYFKTPQDALEAQPGFPLITKGRRGLSFYKTFGRKVFLAETEAALREQLAFIEKHYDIGDTFTQELIPFDGSNRTVSFTSFCIGGEIKAHWTGIKLREHPWRFGTATLAESTVIPECRQHAERLLRALDYSGVCEVEFLYDPRSREYKLIEVNARTWLWVGLARACGVDYALMLYHYVNGHEMVYPQDYRQGLKWINRLTDTFISLRAILQGQLKISEYIQSLRGPKVSAIFSWRDPWPSVMFPFLALLLARKRKFLN